MFPTVQLCLLLSLLVLMHEPISYSMYTKYVIFFIKLLGIHKFIANVMDKDHKITNLHHSVA